MTILRSAAPPPPLLLGAITVGASVPAAAGGGDHHRMHHVLLISIDGMHVTSSGALTTAPSRIIDSCLPDSESNAGNQIGPTEDDVSLLWLKRSCSAETEVMALEMQSPASHNIAGIGQIFWGTALTQMFNAPGLPPRDPRTPDIIVVPNVGVTYSKSTAKQAEHGGFAHDDTNVMLLLSNPSFSPQTFTAPVQTAQVAPTLLKALGLDPQSLQAVRIEGTQVLPGLPQHEETD